MDVVAAVFPGSPERLRPLSPRGKGFTTLLSLVSSINPEKPEITIDRTTQANSYCLFQKPDEERGWEVPRRQSLKCKTQSR